MSTGDCLGYDAIYATHVQRKGDDECQKDANFGDL